ncbi:MAG TPA: cytochrome c maturation protein CcmE [Gammaproteobacteria bacterium]|jgi:cytochrome c-type biogenesis protein CcmE|nr:cytochrome c maturation protein CcmE [Gammaproteobacteria bacterium]
MTLRQRRMMAVMVVLVGISAAAALALTAFRKNLLFFYSPTQIVTGEAPQDSPIRLGGLVVEGGVVRKPQSLEVRFDLTDLAHTVTVVYTGILPDLFREGQGIIAHGRMRPDHTFEATEVLAKHDENYMPPEVAGALAKVKAKP